MRRHKIIAGFSFPYDGQARLKTRLKPALKIALRGYKNIGFAAVLKKSRKNLTLDMAVRALETGLEICYAVRIESEFAEDTP